MNNKVMSKIWYSIRKAIASPFKVVCTTAIAVSLAIMIEVNGILFPTDTKIAFDLLNSLKDKIKYEVEVTEDKERNS